MPCTTSEKKSEMLGTVTAISELLPETNPRAMAFGATGDPQLAYEAGKVTGTEAGTSARSSRINSWMPGWWVWKRISCS